MAIALLAAWTARQWLIWLPGGADFASGWRGAAEPAVTLALFAAAAFLLRDERGTRRAVLAAALLGAAWADYKVFGVSRRFNAAAGDVDEFYAGAMFRGLDDSLYRRLLEQPEFRLAIDETTRFSTELRHVGLSTPQGFDPFVPAQYRKAIEAFTPFFDEREFKIDPARPDMLQLLGVRYYLTTQHGPFYGFLSTSPHYRLLQPAQSFFRLFEFNSPLPAYRWDGPCRLVRWLPETREFSVRSQTGGRFILIEQFFPGWRARVDGVPAPIERWGEAFQSIPVGPGEHRVEFEFRSRGLRIGAVLSLVSLGCLWGFIRRS